MTGTNDTGNSASRSGSRPSRMAYRRRYRLQAAGTSSGHAVSAQLRSAACFEPTGLGAVMGDSWLRRQHHTPLLSHTAVPSATMPAQACCTAVLHSLCRAHAAADCRQLRSHAAPEHVLRGGPGAADLDGNGASAAGGILRAVPAGQKARLRLCSHHTVQLVFMLLVMVTSVVLPAVAACHGLKLSSCSCRSTRLLLYDRGCCVCYRALSWDVSTGWSWWHCSMNTSQQSWSATQSRWWRLGRHLSTLRSQSPSSSCGMACRRHGRSAQWVGHLHTPAKCCG
jgi:hypothetical protein